MQKFFTVLVAIVVLTNCASNKKAASKSDVYSWGGNTLDELSSVYPSSFQAMFVKAMIPDDYDYSKRNLTYDKTSNMQVSLDPADKEFLRNAGILSSIAEYCELDWVAKNYSPMMQWQRLQVPISERNGYQIAIVGVSHGYAMGKTDEWLSNNNAKCDQVRNILNGNLFSDNF